MSEEPIVNGQARALAHKLAEAKTVLCPRCEYDYYTPYGVEWEPGDPLPPALSRLTRGKDDAPIYVCSQCGQEEAMQEHFNGFATPASEWPVERG